MTERFGPLIERLDGLADEAEHWLEELRRIAAQLKEEAAHGPEHGGERA